LFEVIATSDRFKGKSGKPVKSHSNFRQVRRKKRKSCQKTEQLQTGSAGKAEKLSKDRATSDRFSRKNGKAVKRQSNFRQVQPEKRKSCQKTEQLQTGSTEKVEKLSKDRATSDRFSGKRGKAVRSRSNFRQVQPEKRKTCLNHGHKGFEMLSILHYVKMASFLKNIKGWECENCINRTNTKPEYDEDHSG
jgi:hypothetical protein